jgi:hypothetical protein
VSVRARLVVAVSAALLLAQLARLAYLAPGSLGAREDNFDGFAIALVVLTMVNFGAALLICVTAVPRHLRGMRNFRAVPEVQADLTFRLSELLSRRWKALVAIAYALAVPAVVYGIYEARNVYDNGGHYYRQGHGHPIPISHDQYVTAAHPPLVAGAGVMTALQATALLLTFLALDRLASRGYWAIWSDPSEAVVRTVIERGAPAPDKAPPE